MEERGKILYKEKRNPIDPKHRMIIGFSMLIFLTIAVVFFFSFKEGETACFAGSGFLSVILLMIWGIIIFRIKGRFIIYENGIQFSDSNIGFVWFRDIKDIRFGRTKKKLVKYIVVKRKGSRDVTIGGNDLKNPWELTGDLDGIESILINHWHRIKDGKQKDVHRERRRIKKLKSVLYKSRTYRFYKIISVAVVAISGVFLVIYIWLFNGTFNLEEPDILLIAPFVFFMIFIPVGITNTSHLTVRKDFITFTKQLNKRIIRTESIEFIRFNENAAQIYDPSSRKKWVTEYMRLDRNIDVIFRSLKDSADILGWDLYLIDYGTNYQSKFVILTRKPWPTINNELSNNLKKNVEIKVISKYSGK